MLCCTIPQNNVLVHNNTLVHKNTLLQSNSLLQNNTLHPNNAFLLNTAKQGFSSQHLKERMNVNKMAEIDAGIGIMRCLL